MQGKFKKILDEKAGIRSLDGYIYHYTTVDGAMGILESEAIYASDVTFLNDSLEVKYGFGLVKSFVQHRIDNAKRAVTRNALSRLLRNFEQTPIVFAACFCMDQDLLSQWRGYGRHQGVSIGVKTQSLLSKSEFDTYRVIYSPTSQNALIDKFIAEYLSGWMERQSEK